MINPFLYFLFVISSLLFSQSQAFAFETESTPSGPPHLEILFATSPVDTIKLSREKIQRHIKYCNAFGHYLQKNQGLYGTGPFVNVHCRDDGDLNKNKGAGKTLAPWTLTITGSDEGATFEITHKSILGVTIVAAKLVVSEMIDPAFLIQDKKLSQLIAAHLSISLPMRSVIARSKFKSGAKIYGRGISRIQVLPPPELKVFDLETRNGLWFSYIQGTMKLSQDSITSQIWEVKGVDMSSKNEYLYIQQDSDRQEMISALEKEISTQADSFLRRLESAGRTAYVGVRYGLPLIAGEGSLGKSPLYGILGEFRAGRLRGLRINIDMIPKRDTSTNGVSESYNSSRIQLGFSLGMRVPFGLINWIDVTPRIGVTSMNYELSAPLESQDYSASFVQSRAPTTGVELGLENRRPAYLIRAWGFANYSFGVLKLDKNYSTKSFRIGVDIYKDVVNFDSLRLAILGFSAYDSTKIVSIDSSDETNTIAELQLVALYLGGGLTISW